MNEKYLVVFVFTAGLILGGVSATPSVRPQTYAYATTETNPEYLVVTPEEESIGKQDNSENQTQTETQTDNQSQGVSGGSKKDKIAPSIVSRSPNVGTINIPVNTNIAVTFDEPLKSSSLSTSTFQLKNEDDA